MKANRAFGAFCLFALICLSEFLLQAHSCVGQQPQISNGIPGSALKQFLRKKLTDPDFGRDKTTRYSSAIIKSNGVTKEEIVVYVSGQTWCGSGGCRLFILEPDGVSFKVIGEEIVVRPPIRVLRSKSRGHFDIGVWVQGGGIQPGYEAQLRFDGKSYPANPSVAPARKLTGEVAGTVLISNADSRELLYK